MELGFNRVFIGDSSYALMLYLLMSTKEEIDSTLFFVSDGLPLLVRENLRNQSVYFDSKDFLNKSLFNRKRFLFTIKLRFTAYKKWPILKTADLFGQEISFYAPSLIGHRKFVCYEDGISTYKSPSQGLKFLIKSFVKSLIMGPSAYPGWTGRCKKNINYLVLTGLYKDGFREDIPHVFIDIKKLWDCSSEEKKKRILDIYGVTDEDVKQLKSRSILLLTQPLSQDLIISEEVRKQLLVDLIGDIDYSQITVKVHPRESFNPYYDYFPGIYVFEKKVPMQLLNLLDINYDKVLTLFSTAAFDYMGKSEIVFKGSEVHPSCVKRYGIIRMPEKQNEK